MKWWGNSSSRSCEVDRLGLIDNQFEWLILLLCSHQTEKAGERFGHAFRMGREQEQQRIFRIALKRKPRRRCKEWLS